MSLGCYTENDLKALSKESLEKLRRDCEIELQKRKEERYNLLVKDVCRAVNLLVKEYPFVELNVFKDCDQCGEENVIDVLEYFYSNGGQLTEKDFS